MRRKAVPIKNSAVGMIAAGREEKDLTKERNDLGVTASAPLQLHVDASTTLKARTDRSTEQGDAEDGVQTKQRHPIGVLQAAAIGTSIGIASTMLYLWCMERRRQDDLVWDYYRSH